MFKDSKISGSFNIQASRKEKIHILKEDLKIQGHEYSRETLAARK